MPSDRLLIFHCWFTSAPPSTKIFNTDRTASFILYCLLFRVSGNGGVVGRPSPRGEQREVARLSVPPLLQLALVGREALGLLLVLDVLSTARREGRREGEGKFYQI